MHGLRTSCRNVQYGFPLYSTLERPKDTLAAGLRTVDTQDDLATMSNFNVPCLVILLFPKDIVLDLLHLHKKPFHQKMLHFSICTSCIDDDIG